MRRTAQEKKEIQELLETVLERSREYEITSYQYFHAPVGMTIAGLDKILKGETKMPNIEVLRKMDNYIRENFEVNQSIVAEAKANYGEKTDLEKFYENPDIDLIFKKLEKLENKIDNSSLKQDIIFEIFKNSKEAELEKMKLLMAEKLSSLQA